MFNLKYLLTIYIWTKVMSKSPMMRTIYHFMTKQIPKIKKFIYSNLVFLFDHVFMIIFGKQKTTAVVKSMLMTKMKDLWVMKKLNYYRMIDLDSESMKMVLIGSDEDSDYALSNDSQCNLNLTEDDNTMNDHSNVNSYNEEDAPNR